MKHGEQRTEVLQQLHGDQVTIPAEFRRALGIERDSLLQLTLANGELRIRPVDRASGTSGSDWLRDAYDAFAPIRQELAQQYSGEEIDAAIDGAVEAVRRRNAARRL